MLPALATAMERLTGQAPAIGASNTGSFNPYFAQNLSARSNGESGSINSAFPSASRRARAQSECHRFTSGDVPNQDWLPFENIQRRVRHSCPIYRTSRKYKVRLCHRICLGQGVGELGTEVPGFDCLLVGNECRSSGIEFGYKGVEVSGKGGLGRIWGWRKVGRS